MEYSQTDLQNLQPTKDFFVGVDSDGCIFDTMEIKQKECFCPCNIKYWDLQPISKYVREATEFVNLYSKWRGSNRFVALLKIFDLLAERREVLERGFTLPDIQALRDWVIATGVPRGNAALADEVERTGDPVLARTLQWTLGVSAAIEDLVKHIPPFVKVRETLEVLQNKADVICVSQTPIEALEREWTEHDLLQYIRLVAGQEYGSKSDHLRLAAVGKYDSDKILMIGDALGDLEAALANDVCFFPIYPGAEDASWKLLYEEALTRFFDGSYRGNYENDLIEKFRAMLPEKPSWDKGIK